MTKHGGMNGMAIGLALFLAMGWAGQSHAASARERSSATPGKSSQAPSEKLSLYVEQAAFMSYCGIAMDDGAVSNTLTAVGLKGVSISAIKSQAQKLVPQLEALNGPGKFDFCKRAKTIPIVQAWSVKQ